MEKALDQPKSDITWDSAILRFELIFEVGWKLIQTLARQEGYQANSPRQAFEQAFSMGWITDEEIWADILKDRNTAVHVYQEKLAEDLYDKLEPYYKAFKTLHNSIC